MPRVEDQRDQVKGEASKVVTPQRSKLNDVETLYIQTNRVCDPKDEPLSIIAESTRTENSKHDTKISAKVQLYSQASIATLA